jgi:hypothetical protein
MFAAQLRFHLTAEATALWSPARAKLAGDPPGQASLDAMEDDQAVAPACHDDTPDKINDSAHQGRRRLKRKLRRPKRCHCSPRARHAWLPVAGRSSSQL